MCAVSINIVVKGVVVRVVERTVSLHEVRALRTVHGSNNVSFLYAA